jgi:hypothetical protein
MTPPNTSVAVNLGKSARRSSASVAQRQVRTGPPEQSPLQRRPLNTGAQPGAAGHLTPGSGFVNRGSAKQSVSASRRKSNFFAIPKINCPSYGARHTSSFNHRLRLRNSGRAVFFDQVAAVLRLCGKGTIARRTGFGSGLVAAGADHADEKGAIAESDMGGWPRDCGALRAGIGRHELNCAHSQEE